MSRDSWRFLVTPSARARRVPPALAGLHSGFRQRQGPAVSRLECPHVSTIVPEDAPARSTPLLGAECMQAADLPTAAHSARDDNANAEPFAIADSNAGAHANADPHDSPKDHRHRPVVQRDHRLKQIGNAKK